VDDLDGGPLSGVATYLPGRRVPGIRISDGRLEVHVRGAWNVPVATIASQIRSALAALAPGMPIDIVLTDVAEPGQAKASAALPAGVGRAAGNSVESWTTPSASDEPSGVSSSVPTIPTAAEIRPNS
jgi:hypothetical protein